MIKLTLQANDKSIFFKAEDIFYAIGAKDGSKIVLKNSDIVFEVKEDINLIFEIVCK